MGQKRNGGWSWLYDGAIKNSELNLFQFNSCWKALETNDIIYISNFLVRDNVDVIPLDL